MLSSLLCWNKTHRWYNLCTCDIFFKSTQGPHHKIKKKLKEKNFNRQLLWQYYTSYWQDIWELRNMCLLQEFQGVRLPSTPTIKCSHSTTMFMKIQNTLPTFPKHPLGGVLFSHDKYQPKKGQAIGERKSREWHMKLGDQLGSNSGRNGWGTPLEVGERKGQVKWDHSNREYESQSLLWNEWILFIEFKISVRDLRGVVC